MAQCHLSSQAFSQFIRPSSLLSYTNKTDCILKYLLSIDWSNEKDKIESNDGSFQVLFAVGNLSFGRLCKCISKSESGCWKSSSSELFDSIQRSKQTIGIISFRQNKESIVYLKIRMQSFQARLLSRVLKLLPTPLICLRQSMAWTTITIKSKWIIKWHSRTTGMMRSSVVVVNSPKFNHPIGKGQTKKSRNICPCSLHNFPF